MDQAIPIALNGVNMGAQHFDKVYDPLKHKYYKRKGYYRDDPDVQDHRTPEEKGYVLRRRRDVGSDEEIVETVRHRGEILPRRPGRPKEMARKASSFDDLKTAGKAAAAGGGAAGAMVPYRNGRGRGGDSSDSEGSIPPRSRVRPKSTSGRSHASRRRRGSDSSSSDSSSVCSSTEDEKNVKKMQRKKWITAAFASVATVHAATKVYSSIEAHDKRVQDVATGKMSPEEAHKKQRSARWQDAAAIGIAALGIRGALSEWHEVQEEHSQHREMMEKKEMHHKKRLESMRRKRAQERGGYYKGRDGQWYYDGPMPQSSQSKSSNNDGRYDDQRAIKDSERQQKMLEYEEKGTHRAGDTEYDFDHYRNDYDKWGSEDGRSRDKSRRRDDRSRAHSRAYFHDDDYDDRRSRYRREKPDDPTKNPKLEKPKDTAKDLGVNVAGELLSV
ncbi:uncharacterized protein HMPREF1541_06286 [Cyphellophora europaea CBS 101466]|uniref:Uncharacterized protein n=1 Tax=Cyphellophora europaea (strain CBS 101466) TaxID=1220924 RepID=W2RPK3_CYPE1|nr:uncharacterized protein HMPREF1541_06286 [Cyphellophora europaea CBS 101466]ETN38255.1 hypothetical protein HMPREF1541_06286 [Cyphellophora europaea CBS 101466]